MKQVFALIIVVLAVLIGFSAEYVWASDFAVEVVDYSGLSGSGFYNEPCSVLGKPARWIYDTSPEHSGDIYACSLVYPAWSVDPNGSKLVTTISNGAYIVVKFDHKVADDAGNLYGMDFIVYGNAKFTGSDYMGLYLDPDTDMEQYYIHFQDSYNLQHHQNHYHTLQ